MRIINLTRSPISEATYAKWEGEGEVENKNQQEPSSWHTPSFSPYQPEHTSFFWSSLSHSAGLGSLLIGICSSILLWVVSECTYQWYQCTSDALMNADGILMVHLNDMLLMHSWYKELLSVCYAWCVVVVLTGEKNKEDSSAAGFGSQLRIYLHHNLSVTVALICNLLFFYCTPCDFDCASLGDLWSHMRN